MVNDINNDDDDNDNALFRKAMADVKPLQKPQKHLLKTKSTDNKHIRRHHAENFTHVKNNPIKQKIVIGAEESIFFNQNGVLPKTIKKLKQGQLAVELRIDLHGETLATAEDRLAQCLQQAIEYRYRHILIIHGKSNRLAHQQPVLKNFVYHYLRQHPMVLAASSALPRDGGTGALYVLLKKQR